MKREDMRLLVEADGVLHHLADSHSTDDAPERLAVIVFDAVIAEIHRRGYTTDDVIDHGVLMPVECYFDGVA